MLRPRLALDIIYIVSESQTRINGRDPIEPVTTRFRYGQIPNDIISSTCPFTYFNEPAPINLCLSVFVFMTTPMAAAG